MSTRKDHIVIFDDPDILADLEQVLDRVIDTARADWEERGQPDDHVYPAAGRLRERMLEEMGT